MLSFSQLRPIIKLKKNMLRVNVDSQIFFHGIIRLEQWFPKSGPRTIFGPRDFQIWSARQKILVKLQYFMQIFVKIVS